LENIYSDPVMRIIPDPAGSGATTLSYRYITYIRYLLKNQYSIRNSISKKEHILFAKNAGRYLNILKDSAVAVRTLELTRIDMFLHAALVWCLSNASTTRDVAGELCSAVSRFTFLPGLCTGLGRLCLAWDEGEGMRWRSHERRSPPSYPPARGPGESTITNPSENDKKE
jgi:hypothetical protein